MQIEANASKCEQLLENENKYKQMQATPSKYKQLQAIHVEALERISKLKEISVKAGPPRINKPSIWKSINPKRLFEDNIDNITQRQSVKQNQGKASKYK